MRYSVTATPRRLARLARQTPVLLRVSSGTVRISDQQESLFDGGGLAVSAADGVQNWIMPECELWLCADSAPAIVEIILP